jgi:hypothetical protein
MPTRNATILAASAALAVALLIHPTPAHAGTYTVHTCHTPTGTLTGTAGWTSTASTPIEGQDSGTATSCTSQNASLRLQFGVAQLPVAPSRSTSWAFSAPTATHISSVSLFRTFTLGWPVIAGRYNRPYVYDAWHDADTAENQLDFALPPFNSDTTGTEYPESFDRSAVSWASLHVRLSCWGLVGSLDCGPFPAQVVISRAAIGLADERAPEGEATGGTLTGPDAVRGVAGLSLHATDQGGGVYRVALSVDGDEVQWHVLDAGGGTCTDVEPANDDDYEFGTARPCPLDATGAAQLDTASLRDGQHTIRATVEDAGGNATVVFDRTVQTHNAPIGTAAPSLAGQTSVGGQLTAAPGQWDGAPTGYDHRWLRCDADGAGCAPIAGATGPTYVLGDQDAYHRIRIEITAENGSGAASARSAPSALVADAAGHTAPSGHGGGGAQAGGNGSGPGGIQGAVNPLGGLPGHVANGDAASAHARISAAFPRADGSTVRRVRIAATRRTTIVGRLTDAWGIGIGGAELGAAWRVAGRDWVARPGVRTGIDGRFVYVLPPGPTRDVRFTYFAYSDSRAVELSNVVHADVQAPLTIRADHRHVSGARVVRLDGRVGGGSIPRGGLLVTLQGYQAGWGWRAFRTVRTDRDGRWSTRYRFRLTAGTFGFRALLPHQAAFPYASSRSQGVYVVVS